VNHLARHQVLNEPGGRRIRVTLRDGGRTRALPFVLAVDPRDPAAKSGELGLYILHASLFLCSLYNTSRQQRTRYIRKVIKSAVVPVAGHGTRLLPATKSQPKEMLPVARKPIVQYVVEELVSNGIQQVLFVTGRNKASIENHFDSDPELFRVLSDAKKQDLLRELEFDALKANFFYTRQRMQKGLGDAILCGENFAGEEPFLVALGDSILGLHAVSRAVSRMAEVFDSKRASCVIAVEEVPREETSHYGIVQPENGPDDVFRIVNLVEKPSPADAPSNLAIAGRYIFSPVIFDQIRRVQPDHRGEIQLTNAIQFLCEEGRRVVAVKLAPEEKRYDIGNFPSYFESFVEFALADPVYGDEFRRVLERLLASSAAKV
jgi:UTP--glucose-1-phosphate uridylyltransferase